MPAYVDSTFQRVVDELRDFVYTAAVSGSPVGVRIWSLPDDNDATVSPWEPLRIAAAFHRAGVNAMYETAIKDSGSLGDCAAAHLQGNHLAAAERAYRLRSASRVRLSAWRAARHLGHAEDLGPLNRLTSLVQNFVAAGVDPGGRPQPPSPSEIAAAEARADQLNQAVAQAVSDSSFASPFS